MFELLKKSMFRVWKSKLFEERDLPPWECSISPARTVLRTVLRYPMYFFSFSLHAFDVVGVAKGCVLGVCIRVKAMISARLVVSSSSIILYICISISISISIYIV